MSAVRARCNPLVTVICPGCGGSREVTARTVRRNHAQHKQTLCRVCAKSAVIQPTESLRWWWLRHYGVKRNGRTAEEYVLEHGYPPGLDEWIRYLRR